MARMARVEVFAADEIAIVHLINRAVRRCFLLGDNPVLEKNYDHRTQWLDEHRSSSQTISDPKFATPWNNKGGALHQLRRYEEAMVCYDKAIELDPKDVWHWFNRSEDQMAMNQWHEALTQLQTAMQQFQPTPEHDVASKIELVRSAFAAGNDATVQDFAQLYVEFDAITQLGDGLVRSLAEIDVENATEVSLQKWRDSGMNSARSISRCRFRCGCLVLGLSI